MPVANEIAVDLDKRFEGCRLSVYLCPAGIPTIGGGSTHYEDGSPVGVDDPPITQERAGALLTLEQMRVDLRIRAHFGPIGAFRLGALGSFAYNLGCGALFGSTLARMCLAGNHAGAEAQFGRWVHGGGRRLPGLVKRRAAEAGVYGFE